MQKKLFHVDAMFNFWIPTPPKQNWCFHIHLNSKFVNCHPAKLAKARARRCYDKAGFKFESTRPAAWGGNHCSEWQSLRKAQRWKRLVNGWLGVDDQ